MAFDILIAGGGNAAEQCFYLIACPIAFVLVILQGVNERFLQRNQKVSFCLFLCLDFSRVFVLWAGQRYEALC